MVLSTQALVLGVDSMLSSASYVIWDYLICSLGFFVIKMGILTLIPRVVGRVK